MNQGAKEPPARDGWRQVKKPHCKITKAPSGEGAIQSLMLLSVSAYMSFERREALWADDVFNAAGILGSQPGLDAQGNEPVGNQRMPLIDGLGNAPPIRRQGDKTVLIHLDIAMFP